MSRSLRRGEIPKWLDTIEAANARPPGGTLPRRKVRRSGRLKFGLTRLQFQLVSDLLAGRDDCEIARRASLDEKALALQLAALFEKLGVHDRLELVLLLVDRGF